MQSYSQIITTTNPTRNFLQTRCPSCHPINSVEALEGLLTLNLTVSKHRRPHTVSTNRLMAEREMPNCSLVTYWVWSHGFHIYRHIPNRQPNHLHMLTRATQESANLSQVSCKPVTLTLIQLTQLALLHN